MAIWFNTEANNFNIRNKRKLKAWIGNLITGRGYNTGNINYVFVSKNSILAINKQFLNHSYYTDIITFDHRDTSYRIDADLYLCPEVIKENAHDYQSDFNTELKRVIIHGIFHLTGLNDKTPKEKAQMRKLEDTALKDVKELIIV